MNEEKGKCLITINSKFSEAKLIYYIFCTFLDFITWMRD